MGDQIKTFLNVNFRINGKRTLVIEFDPTETVYATSFNVSEYGMTQSMIERKNLLKDQERLK